MKTVSGVQQRLLHENPKALFVNCTNHSLNLVGVHAVSENVMMVSFFGVVDKIYAFFAGSTDRWNQIKDCLELSLKYESDTRWSSRVEAMKPIFLHLNELINLLDKMSKDKSNNAKTQATAGSLATRILQPDFLCLVTFWTTILCPLDRVQKRLQDKSMNFHEASLDIKSLEEHFLENGDTIISDAIKNGAELCNEWNIETTKRIRFKKRKDEERIQYPSLLDDIKMQMKEIIVIIVKKMNERFTRLHDLDSKFGFLLDVNQLFYGECIDLKQKCSLFSRYYDDAVSANELYSDIIDCKMLLKPREKLNTPLEVLQFIVSFGDENVFPNLRVAIQILLTVAISIASCERSFSKLKLILTYLRATMQQQRLNDLAIISIEEKSNDPTDFEEVINCFASLKARQVPL